MVAPSHLSTHNLAIWKQLPRDLVEIIVDIAAEMLDDEVGVAPAGSWRAIPSVKCSTGRCLNQSRTIKLR